MHGGLLNRLLNPCRCSIECTNEPHSANGITRPRAALSHAKGAYQLYPGSRRTPFEFMAQSSSLDVTSLTDVYMASIYLSKTYFDPTIHACMTVGHKRTINQQGFLRHIIAQFVVGTLSGQKLIYCIYLHTRSIMYQTILQSIPS